MKNAKFVLLSLLTMLLLSQFTCAMAAEAPIHADPGDIVSVTVSMEGTASIAGFKVFLDYDTSVFSLVMEEDEYAVTQGSFSTKGALTPNATESGCQVLWYHTANVTASGSLFTVKLRTAASAPAGVYTMNTRVSAEDTLDKSGTPVPISCSAPGVLLGAASCPTIGCASSRQLTGETFTMPVSLTDNPGICGFAFSVDVPDGMSLTGIRRGALLNGGELVANPAERSVCWYCANAVTGDGELLLLDFAVSEDCAAGEKPVGLRLLDDSPKNLTDGQGAALYAVFSPATVSVSDYTPGDADGDGEITMSDVLKLARHMVKLELLTGKCYEAADVDKDGLITVADCVRLAKYVAKLIPAL